MKNQQFRKVYNFAVVVTGNTGGDYATAYKYTCTGVKHANKTAVRIMRRSL